MKRTFKRSDGTEETLEGTAEELAEYERKVNESERKDPKPGVLKGKGLDDLLREIQATPERVDLALRPSFTWPPVPIWIISCSICGRVSCNGYHGDPSTPYCDGGVTITTTGDAVRMMGAVSRLPSDTQIWLCRESTSS